MRHITSQPKNGKYEIQFAVKDTCIGISEDRVGCLFQSFRQGGRYLYHPKVRQYGPEPDYKPDLAELMGWGEFG